MINPDSSLNINAVEGYSLEDIDFDVTKNYHRILFKPGYSVQARELTQSQTILQNQITSFADAIFASVSFLIRSISADFSASRR